MNTIISPGDLADVRRSKDPCPKESLGTAIKEGFPFFPKVTEAALAYIVKSSILFFPAF